MNRVRTRLYVWMCDCLCWKLLLAPKPANYQHLHHSQNPHNPDVSFSKTYIALGVVGAVATARESGGAEDNVVGGPSGRGAAER